MSFRRPVRISLWQGALEAPELTTWKRQLRKRAQEAKARQAEILLTPELMLPGYDVFGKQGFDLDPKDIEEEIKRCAMEVGLVLCVGYAESIEERDRAPGKTHWNTALLVDSHGSVVLRYRKHHCWGNEGNLGLQESSDNICVANLKLPDGACIRTSILICYDVEYPEMVRIVALQKAELILVPTALPYTEPNVSTKIIPATAMQNRLFIAYCNLPCLRRVSGEYFAGHSCVAGLMATTGPGPWDGATSLGCKSCCKIESHLQEFPGMWKLRRGCCIVLLGGPRSLRTSRVRRHTFATAGLSSTRVKDCANLATRSLLPMKSSTASKTPEQYFHSSSQCPDLSRS